MKKGKFNFVVRVVSVLLVLISLSACSKSARVRWVYYDETNCADKWEYSNNNELLKNKIMEYLESKGVTVFEIEIFNQLAAESCADCTCKTGRQIKCKIKKSDVDNAKAEGFRE